MRIEQKSFFVGDIPQNKKEENVFYNKNKTVTPIEEKQKEAKKQAKKIVDKAVTIEKKLDEDLADRVKYITKLRENMVMVSNDLSGVDKTRETLKKEYAIADDSREQKDLELLEKEMDANEIDSDVTLSEEEKERLLEIKKTERTEYQERMLNSYNEYKRLQNTFKAINKEVENEVATIKAIKLERLKMHIVVDATKEAKEILKASSKEIQGTIIEDTKEKVEEKMEKVEEDADKKAEAAKEQEEKMEALKEKLAKMEQLARKQKNNTNPDDLQTPITAITDVMTEMDVKNNEIQAEVDNIMKKMKLLADDFKGIMVDSKQ